MGWKEEEILGISDGGNILMDISFWRNHSEPRGTSTQHEDSHKGRMIFIKNVRVLGIETGADFDLIYAEISNGPYENNHIIMAHMDDRSIHDFRKYGKPFLIDQDHSILPEYVKNKKTGTWFPLLCNEITAVKEILGVHVNYLELKENVQKYGDFDDDGSYMIRTLRRRFDKPKG